METVFSILIKNWRSYYMKQKSIMALFLGAVLVLTFSSVQIAFADYDDEYDEKYERDYDDDKYHDSEEKECESEHEKEYKSERDYDDKYEKERRS